MRKKPELLMPAGNLRILKTAFIYGADAVYIGGEMFSLRARADNFSLEEMKEGVEFAHARGKKVYVTANITAHNADMKEVAGYFTELQNVRPDALIISDPGVMMMAKKYCPEIEIHVSTQANNVNAETFKFWHGIGATRVVSARELSIKEIKEIRAEIPDELEIETFVHGAMCISHSGRCLLSHYFTGRDANLGACTHPCRWKYYVMEEKRPGEYLPVFENERGTYIFNSRDLCMIEYIPELVDAGIDSFKVEGRMKTALYVATVARAYRQAIDDYFESLEKYESRKAEYVEEVSKCTYRRFTTAFFFGFTSEETQVYDHNTYIKDYVYLGQIQGKNEKGLYAIEQKNKFSVGDEVEIMHPDGTNETRKVLAMEDENGVPMENCPHPKQKIYLDIGCELSDYDMLRKKEA